MATLPYGNYADLRRYQAAAAQPLANPLDSLIQGVQQGAALSQLPQTIQDNALNAQIQQALALQKLQQLQTGAVENVGGSLVRYNPQTGKAEVLFTPASTARASPFQSVGLTQPNAEGAVSGVNFNPVTGEYTLTPLPTGVTDIRPKVTTPPKAASTRGLTEGQKISELSKASKVGVDVEQFKDPATGQIDWQAVATARGTAEGESVKASNLIRDARKAATASKGGKPTVSEANFQLYGNRMESSNSILDKLEQKGFDPSSLGTEGLVGSWSPNILKSSERQQFEQAQRDFINAALRRESGAVISDAEFENARQQYFTQPGDSSDVITQKKENRGLVSDEFKRLGGQVSNTPTPSTSSTASGMVRVLNPSGKVGSIPSDKLEGALKAGFKLAP